MAGGRLILLLAVCLFAQSVRAGGYKIDHHCEAWYGKGGCDASCKAPWHKCCAVEKPVCSPKCEHYYGYCVKDPDFCKTKVVKECKKVPKKVCEPICKRVKVQVCKNVPVKKCFDGPKECYDDVVCKKVPKKVCKTVPKCTKKKVCGGGRADAGADAYGVGAPSYAKTDTSASTSPGGAHAHSSGKAGGSHSSSAASYASASSGGCKYVDVCKDVKVCETVYEKKCETKRVCKPGKKICKTVYEKQCEYVWKNDCSEKKCRVVNENVCVKKEVEECKDLVKCGGVKCGHGYKCNPVCCPLKKVPICIDV